MLAFALLLALPATAQAAPAQPVDAPAVDANTKVRVPPIPEGYNTHDEGWIRFAYHPTVRERIQPLIEDANAIRHDLAARLGQPVLNDVHVRIARSPKEMAALAPENAPFPKEASGVAYSGLGLILLTIEPVFPNSKHELSEIYKHELAHVALHDAVDGRPVPRWFNEGFAVYASGESSFDRLQALWTATLAEDLIPLRELEHRFPHGTADISTAYAEAADVVRFLVRKEDRHRFANLIDRLQEGTDFETALETAYGTDLHTLEYEWRQDVAKRYTFWPVLLSGTVVWVGIIGLFAWGWRRRKRRANQTLARWDHEERLQAEQRQRSEAEEPSRVHIVFAPMARTNAAQLRSSSSETDVPKVEHEGLWHTLH